MSTIPNDSDNHRLCILLLGQWVHRTAVFQLQLSPQLSEETVSDRELLLCNFPPGVNREESSSKDEDTFKPPVLQYIPTVYNFSAREITREYHFGMRLENTHSYEWRDIKR